MSVEVETSTEPPTHPDEKGSGSLCPQHPTGRSGKSSPTALADRGWMDLSAPPPKPQRNLMVSLLRIVIFYLLPLAVVAGGLYAAKWLIETAPQAERRPPGRQATLVEVGTFGRSTTNAVIQVMGTVLPAQQVQLQPRVSGEVVKLSPQLVPGGFFKAGDFLLQIDPRDYELAVQRAKGQVAQAEYEWKVEQGHQEIAQREWQLLDMGDKASDLDRELALRKPHLARIEASVESAKATLREAELNLERTKIVAPFNCMVTAENVDLGAQVTPQTLLATLVGTDEYWVQAAVPVDQLKWIRFPDEQGQGGSPATLHQELGTGTQGKWTGRVVRLLGDLEPRGRMARALISVADPLHLKHPGSERLPLLIDAYVNVSIEGKEVRNVVALPRTVLREGREIWVMNDSGALEIRQADIVWSNEDTVLVGSGIAPGERVVVTDLPAPVAGMALAVHDQERTGAAEGGLGSQSDDAEKR